MRRVLFVAAMLISAHATAQVSVTPKHLLIVRPGIDAVWGSYVFAVQNDGESEGTFKGRIMLPKETVDFMPQEGVDPSQVTLSEGGPGNGIQIEAPFPPGVHIVSIGFKVDSRFGKVDLTLVPEQEVSSLTVLTPRGSTAVVQAVDLAPADPSATPDPQYIGYLAQRTLAAGQPYVIKVDGIPEGRTRLWIAGGGVGASLLILAMFMAWRTRPHIKLEEGGEASLVV